MSQIRKAHTLEIVDRRLRDCETRGDSDPMELVGVHDELSRVERKWLEKRSGQHQPANPSRRRPLADPSQLNARFDRLAHLVEATLRRPSLNAADPSRPYLERIAEQLRSRKPLQNPD